MISNIRTMVAVTAFAASIGAAQAETISIGWIGTVLNGPDSLLGTTWAGTLSFDDSFLSLEEEVELGTADGLLLTFDFRGQTFTNSDDTDFDSYPRITLTNGVITDLNFLLVDGDEQGQEIFDGEFAGEDVNVFNLDTFNPIQSNGDGTYSVGLNVNVPAIPEPATWLSMLAGLGLLGLCAGSGSRRRAPGA